jgi:ABC-2 type transport system ATP-binding protein
MNRWLSKPVILSGNLIGLKRYPRVSFQVERGEIFGLLGPNGAGKTTTIRLLMGQIDPIGEHAQVAGCDVVKDRQCLKALTGVVFETQILYDRLSAHNNPQFSCWLYNIPESRINDVLELVRLVEHASEPVRTFSIGKKQRLMTARSLLHDLHALFLDEPTRGLDPIAARDAHDSMEQPRLNGRPILLTAAV